MTKVAPRLFFFIVLLFIFSCEGSSDLPQNVIERQEFVEILADVQIFESTDQFVRNKKTDFNLDHSYDWLFDEHNITIEDFTTSLDYYSRDPKVFEELYDDVITVITEKQIEYKASKTKD